MASIRSDAADHTIVLAALSERSGIAVERLTAHARLREDLLLSAEDAWSLLGMLEERFETDIGQFARCFAAYYPVDARLRWNSRRVVLPAGAAGGIVSGLADWPWWGGVAVATVLGAAAVTLFRRFQPPPRTDLLPVTVAMLLAAAGEGVWCDPRLGDDQASIGT